MPIRVSLDTKEKIQYLRQRGYSLPEISRELNVSRTTVLRYIKGINILSEYLAEWAGKRGGSRKIRLKKERQALENGRKFVGRLSEREKMLFLCALYWAEGTKKDFSLANTDASLVAVFMQCLRDVLKVKDSQFYINIRIYEDLNKDKCLDFWSKIARIRQQDIKGFNVLKGKKKGKLEYGMCRVRVAKGGDILKRIKGINRAVFEELSL